MSDVPSTLKPAQVAHVMVDYAVAKHKDRYESIFLKAVAAGAMLSFGGLLSEIISGGSVRLHDTDPGLLRILSGMVFPVGLIMIVLQGQELLTSNMLYFPMAILVNAVPFWSLCLNWVIVFFGNLAGSLFFAAILVHYSGIVSAEPYASYIRQFAITKAKDPQWHQIFLRGIGCNWLVSVAVWQAAGARETTSKIISVWIPIFVFVACSFDHVVANMFSVPLGIMFGADLSVSEYISKSLFASFFGNIVGALLVALPTTYMYLGDHRAGGYKTAEEGEISSSNSTSTSEENKNH